VATPIPVTFVVPCFNYGRFVGEAVASALGQIGADVRIVIVDDGSNDGTTPAICDALASERVEVVHQANAGPGAARNAGVKLAATEFVVFLDADDTLDPTFVQKLHGAIKEEELQGFRVSHAYCQEVLTDQAHGTWKVPAWDPMLLLVTNLHPITTLLRRSCFEEVGGFDESLGGNYEDWDLWLKLSERGYRGARVREPLFFWRRHSADTMVMRAVQTHDVTFAKIIERHRSTYEQNAIELVKLSNCMLRRFDCNWLDESLMPIPLLYLQGLYPKLEAAGRQIAMLEAQAAASAASISEAELRVREHYESYAAVRMHRAWHNVLARLPGPIAMIPRAIGRIVKSLLGVVAGGRG
jgi:glycosyltransferase involved in cell wall biosynthesis